MKGVGTNQILGHVELLVKSESGEREGSVTPIIQKKLEEVLATSPKLDASQTSSQCGNEGQQGTGERRAETDQTIDEPSEAPWTVFEETFMSCSPVRVREHPQQTLCGGTCMVTVTMWCLKTQKHDGDGVDAQCTLSQSVESRAMNHLLSNARPLGTLQGYNCKFSTLQLQL